MSQRYPFLQLFIALCAGAVFGAGISIARMTDPAVVLGFLKLSGRWDSRLAMAMAGALLAFGPIAAISKRMSKPVVAADWKHLPKLGWDLPLRAWMGAGLFGLGWGLVGLCPGPAVAGLVTLSGRNFVFVIAMLSGLGAAMCTERIR